MLILKEKQIIMMTLSLAVPLTKAKVTHDSRETDGEIAVRT